MPTTVGVIAALGLSAAGMSAQVAATVAPVAERGSDLAPWLQGGGSAAAVAGLVYVARLIVRGDLVPRSVKAMEAELGASIMVAGQREARVLQVAEAQQVDAHARRMQHDETLLLLADVRRSLTDVAQEMQYWREMRDRGTRREDKGPGHR